MANNSEEAQVPQRAVVPVMMMILYLKFLYKTLTGFYIL
jgi:hypothetical protein